MRKIFVVPASGAEPQEHYRDTISKKRTLKEVSKFLTSSDLEDLKRIYSGKDFAIWGSRPGSENIWHKMDEGDYVIFYRGGKFILIGEVAYKVKNKDLANYLWGVNSAGETWECIYFIINEKEINFDLSKFNRYFNYKSNFTPQGFSAIEESRQKEFEKKYGDIYDIILRDQQGREVKEIIEEAKEEIEIPTEEQEEKEPSEHDEIQWRLIRLGGAAGYKIWVPKNDQGKKYKNYSFRDYVAKDFEPGLDIPKPVENIDVVWRFGFQIKSAFEIEYSTSVYSGLLRLSDLKYIAPNSNFPLYIVAPRDRKSKVYNEIKRPSFSNPYLKLQEAIKFLSFDKVRRLDEKYSSLKHGINEQMVEEAAEKII